MLHITENYAVGDIAQSMHAVRNAPTGDTIPRI